MDEHVKQDDIPIAQQGEPDVLTLVKKIQQQLIFLEKKIDTLINSQSQPSQRPPFRERNFSKPPFSKPFRSFGRSEHRGNSQRDDRPPREGNFSEGRPQFDRSQGGESRGFSGPKKKPFFRRRKG